VGLSCLFSFNYVIKVKAADNYLFHVFIIVQRSGSVVVVYHKFQVSLSQLVVIGMKDSYRFLLMIF